MTNFKQIKNLWYMQEADGKWYYIRTEVHQRIKEMEEGIKRTMTILGKMEHTTSEWTENDNSSIQAYGHLEQALKDK